MVLNLFLTPGLGSLLARRFIAGTGQVLLAVGGCGMVMVWFIRLLTKEFALINDLPVSEDTHDGLMKVGFIIFGVSWLWAAITTISVAIEDRRKREAELKEPAKVPPRLN